VVIPNDLKINKRESFRPFTPAVLEEDATLYFDLEKPSPCMLFVASLKKEHRKELTEAYNSTSIFKKKCDPTLQPSCHHTCRLLC